MTTTISSVPQLLTRSLSSPDTRSESRYTLDATVSRRASIEARESLSTHSPAPLLDGDAMMTSNCRGVTVRCRRQNEQHFPAVANASRCLSIFAAAVLVDILENKSEYTC